MRQQARDLLVDAWWSAFYGIGRHSPIAVTVRSRKREERRLRNAIELGRDAEGYFPRMGTGT